MNTVWLLALLVAMALSLLIGAGVLIWRAVLRRRRYKGHSVLFLYR